MHAEPRVSKPWLAAATLVLALVVWACGGHGPGSSSNATGVRISGQMTQLAGSCPEMSVALGSKRIATDSRSAFLDSDCSELREGAELEAEGQWRDDRSLLARRVRRQRQPPEVELRGAIAQLSGSCPNLSFALGAERLVADANTRFKDVSCGNIRNGQSLEVRGTRRADGTILVRDVEPSIEPEQIDVLGALRNLSGSCPSLSFSVGSDVIVTSAATQFKTPCGSLSEGRFVEAEGSRQPDGRIFARQVEAEDTTEAEVEITGSLSALAGTCPNLTFSVRSQAVRTNASTRFENIACTGLRNGLAIEVKGGVQPDRSVLATRIRPER